MPRRTAPNLNPRHQSGAAPACNPAIRRHIAWSVSIAILTGCHEANPRAVPPPADGEELPILHQVAGTHGREDRPMRLVVRDAATLAQVPLVDVPVDFSTQMLLIITLGRRTSDQYQVRVKRVWRQGPALEVDYEILAPPLDAPLALCSPYCIAIVPRCDLNVRRFAVTPPRRRGVQLP